MDFETHVKQTVIALLVVAVGTTGAYAGSLLGQVFDLNGRQLDKLERQLDVTSDRDLEKLLEQLNRRNRKRQNIEVRENDEDDDKKETDQQDRENDEKDDDDGTSGAAQSIRAEDFRSSERSVHDGSDEDDDTDDRPHSSVAPPRSSERPVAIPEPFCGDGIEQRDRGEECDLGEGNREPNSGCNSDCRRTPVCGNGSIEEDEECDEGDRNGDGFCTEECKKRDTGHGAADESSQRSEEPEESSSSEVREEQSSSSIEYETEISLPSTDAYCGDGHVQRDLGEECDDGNYENGDGCNMYCLEERASTESEEDDEDDENKEESSSIPTDVQTSSSEEREDEESSSSEESEGAASSSAAATSSSSESSETTNLGCLNTDGQWTRNRDECAENQIEVIGEEEIEIEVEDSSEEEEQETEVMIMKKPPAIEEPEEQMRHKIEVRLLGINHTEEMRQQLLQSIQAAKKRLQVLRDSSLSDDVRNFVVRSIAWLQQSETYFDDPTRSTDEIRLMVEPIKEVLVTATELVEQDRSKTASVVEVRIDPILTRTETLLMKFRQSFIVLIEKGVSVDESAVEAYISAANAFVEVKAECLADNKSCNRLNDVLEKLKAAQMPLQEMLKEHPEVMEEVEERF